MAPRPEDTSPIDADAAARVIAATRSRKFTPPEICLEALAADLEEIRSRYASFDRSALARLDAQTLAELTKFVKAVATIQEMIGERGQMGRTVCLKEVLLAAIDTQMNLMVQEGLFGDADRNTGAADILRDALLHVRLLRKWASFAVGVSEAFKRETQASKKAVCMAFGKWLPSIYERHFGRAFGISRPPNKAKLGGPRRSFRNGRGRRDRHLYVGRYALRSRHHY